jgi:hypothetical protein
LVFGYGNVLVGAISKREDEHVVYNSSDFKGPRKAAAQISESNGRRQACTTDASAIQMGTGARTTAADAWKGIRHDNTRTKSGAGRSSTGLKITYR